jgi:hypothetical protein
MVEGDPELTLLLHQLAAISEEQQPDEDLQWEWRREQGWDAIGRVVRFLEIKGLRLNAELVPLTRVHQALRDLDRGTVPDLLRPREREGSARPRSQRFDHMVSSILVSVQFLVDSRVRLTEAYKVVAKAFAQSGHLAWQRKPIQPRNVREWWSARDAQWSGTGWRGSYQSQRQSFLGVEAYPLSRDRAEWAVKKLASHPVLQNDGYRAS